MVSVGTFLEIYLARFDYFQQRHKTNQHLEMPSQRQTHLVVIPNAVVAYVTDLASRRDCSQKHVWEPAHELDRDKPLRPKG